LHHIIVTLGPKPAPAQLPSVHDIAHQVQHIAGVVFQKIEQSFGLETRRANVQVRNENCPQTLPACGKNVIVMIV
jgi:hypothetical protein